MIKFSDKLVPKNQQKKWDGENKKWDSSKFWTKNRDCPSKSRTVGKYAQYNIENLGIGLLVILCHHGSLKFVQNDLQEFYSLVEFCNPGILGMDLSEWRFFCDY